MRTFFGSKIVGRPGIATNSRYTFHRPTIPKDLYTDIYMQCSCAVFPVSTVDLEKMSKPMKRKIYLIAEMNVVGGLSTGLSQELVFIEHLSTKVQTRSSPTGLHIGRKRASSGPCGVGRMCVRRMCVRRNYFCKCVLVGSKMPPSI